MRVSTKPFLQEVAVIAESQLEPWTIPLRPLRPPVRSAEIGSFLRSWLRVGSCLGFLHQLLELRVSAQRLPLEIEPQRVAEAEAHLVHHAQFGNGGVGLPKQRERFRLHP